MRDKTPRTGQRVSNKANKQSLADAHPELAAEWHPTRNDALRPTDVTPGSGQKVWWKCPVADDHVWQAMVRNRAKRGHGCRCCSGRQASVTNSLASLYPDLAKEWDFERNGDLTPASVASGTGRKVAWKCDEGPDHRWEASVVNRTKGRGCPVCAGKKIVESTSIAATHPHLVDEWHPDRNGELRPVNVSHGSDKVAWWRCSDVREHVWDTPVKKRTRGDGCPYCSGHRVDETNSLATLRPDISEEWHPELNGDLTPADVTAASDERAWWQCRKDPRHQWETQVKNRTGIATGCPVCSGRTAGPDTSLAATYPEIAAEWHPTRNGDVSPQDVLPQTNSRFWWKCSEGDDHEWEAYLPHRTADGQTCPFCRGCRPDSTTSLAAVNPELAKEWHADLNGDWAPAHVLPYAKARAWWKCPQGTDHVWEATVASRSYGKGCPFCAGKRPSEGYNLAVCNPDVAAEWHPTKNGDLTPLDVTPGQGKKVWWRCGSDSGHEWNASVAQRSSGSGCPYCVLTMTSKIEVRIRAELALLIPLASGEADRKLQTTERLYTVDFLSEELGLVIEFDGSYYHGGREAQDRQKTELLEEAGWTVVRIREHPLEPIGTADVTVPFHADEKQVADTLLVHLQSLGFPIAGVREYLEEDAPQNSERAEEVIARLLDNGRVAA